LNTGISSMSKPKRITGDAIIWVMILGDMTNFMVGFAYYGYLRNADLALFRQSQETLSIPIGASNSLIMLFSSWLMVLALSCVRQGRHKQAANFVLGALACGLAFTALKAWEFAQKAEAGIHFLTNDFYTLYYTLTGLHFTHVVVGTGLLACYAYILKNKPMTPGKVFYFETAAIYWHMVDLLWIVIFTLMYLLP
jgi:nitric oxide reductase NorE protein